MRLASVPLIFATRKTLALLAYLALADGPQPREHLATLFWPEVDPARSLASLRNTLAHLRRALHPGGAAGSIGFLAVTHTTVGLNPEASPELDLQTVEQAYARARADRSSRTPPSGSASSGLLQAAAAAYRGDFLAGFSLGDAPEFDDWADVQREVWRRRLGLILDRLSEIQFADGEFGATAETTALWITLDGLNERAYRRKMRAHFAAGERGQALETYNACRALLGAELQVDPDPATAALAERIRTEHLPDSRQHERAPADTPVVFLGSLFAGRDAEQQALKAGFAHAAAGRPQVVTVRGEAGIGKTRLAAKFLTWAGGQGAVLLRGSAFESGSHLPFQPLAQALRVWLQAGSPPPELAGAAWLSPLAELLPEVREVFPDLPPSGLTAGASQTALFEAFVRLTLTLAQHSVLVIFVDDLHWADTATLDLLQYALRRWGEAGARILLLLSLRTEALHPPGRAAGSLIPWMARLEREAQPLPLDLEPLSQDATVQLVQDCLDPPAPDFAEWLFDETHGHPFYLVETLKDLLERGVLHPRRAGNNWTFAVDPDHDLGQAVRVPSTVGAVVRSRLHRLSPHARELLAAAAALEHELTFGRLCVVAHATEDAALPALDELVSSRLLVEGTLPAPTGAYTFPNDMIRDVVYTEAGEARRRLLHRRALDLLAAAGAPAAVLAHHARAAGLAQAAFAHTLAAGREALRLSALAEAIAHFEQARELAREAPLAGTEFAAQRQAIYQQLAQAYTAGGQLERAAAVQSEFMRLASS